MDVEVDGLASPSPLTRPDGTELENGTRIVLRELQLKLAVNEDRFVQSMSRRFALSSSEMKIHINGTELTRFSVETRFRFPPDALPDGVSEQGGLAEESVDGRPIRWWIGFTPTPIREEELRGISIIARGKMAQRPFMFQRGAGVTAQLGQEYLVGEVFADWIDSNPDVSGDLISSNRVELMAEDERLRSLFEWGRTRLNWALRKRLELTENANLERLEFSPAVKSKLAELTRAERGIYNGIAGRLAKLPETDPHQVEDLVLDLIDAHNDKAVRQMIEDITATAPEDQDKIWQLVGQFGLIDARRLKTIIDARIDVIGKLERLVQEGAKEVPDIHNHVKDNPWLVDPTWELLQDEVDLTKQLEDRFSAILEVGDDGLRADFVYVLGPREPARRDAVILVEIKRARNPDLGRRRATEDEVEKFLSYFLALQAIVGRPDSRPPVVRGLMIADDYTGGALLKRTFYERGEANISFKSWGTVLSDTKSLHMGWLEISRERLERLKRAMPN